MIKKESGVNIFEVMIATTILTIVTISLAEFAFNLTDAANIHSQEIEEVMDMRNASERIRDKVKRAAYIYPSGVDLELYAYNLDSEKTLYQTNTSNAIALMVHNNQDLDSSSSYFYHIYVYFLRENTDENTYELCELASAADYNWSINQNPAEYHTTINGWVTVIAKDIDPQNTYLTYYLNPVNGKTDYSLIGEEGGVSTYDLNALIKGISWDITMIKNNSLEIGIKGFARNVPRNIE
jgi:type II secretory pathway component PulJ